MALVDPRPGWGRSNSFGLKLATAEFQQLIFFLQLLLSDLTVSGFVTPPFP